jgi:hypothetical protein
MRSKKETKVVVAQYSTIRYYIILHLKTYHHNDPPLDEFRRVSYTYYAVPSFDTRTLHAPDLILHRYKQGDTETCTVSTVFVVRSLVQST